MQRKISIVQKRKSVVTPKKTDLQAKFLMSASERIECVTCLISYIYNHEAPMRAIKNLKGVSERRL